MWRKDVSLGPDLWMFAVFQPHGSGHRGLGGDTWENQLIAVNLTEVLKPPIDFALT